MRPVSNKECREAIREAKRCSRKAFDQLVNFIGKFHGWIIDVCQKSINAVEADEIYCDSWADLWENNKEKLKKFKIIDPQNVFKIFKSYIFKHVKYFSLKYLRKKMEKLKRERPQIMYKNADGEYIEEEFIDDKPTPEETLINRENEKLKKKLSTRAEAGLNCACKTISKRDKKIFRESLAGKNSKELSKKYGISSGAIRKIKHSVRKKLKNYLKSKSEWKKDFMIYKKNVLSFIREGGVFKRHFSRKKIFSFVTNKLSLDDIKKFIWHIKHCKKCMDNLEDVWLIYSVEKLQIWEYDEKTKDCPPDDVLRKYILEKLSADEVKKFKKHIETCAHCQGFILLHTYIMLDQEDFEPVPKKLLNRINERLSEYEILQVQKIIDWELKIIGGKLQTTRERLSLIPCKIKQFSQYSDFRKFYIRYFLARTGIVLKNNKINGFFQIRLNLSSKRQKLFYKRWHYAKKIHIYGILMNTKKQIFDIEIPVRPIWAKPICFSMPVGETIDIYIEYQKKKTLFRIKTKK